MTPKTPKLQKKTLKAPFSLFLFAAWRTRNRSISLMGGWSKVFARNSNAVNDQEITLLTFSSWGCIYIMKIGWWNIRDWSFSNLTGFWHMSTKFLQVCDDVSQTQRSRDPSTATVQKHSCESFDAIHYWMKCFFLCRNLAKFIEMPVLWYGKKYMMNSRTSCLDNAD